MRGSTANRERWIAFFICFALQFYFLFLLFLFVSDKMAKNDQMSLPTLEILKERQKMENKILKWYLYMLISAHISFTSVHWFLFLIQTIKLIVCVGFIKKKLYGRMRRNYLNIFAALQRQMITHREQRIYKNCSRYSRYSFNEQ